MQPFRCTLPPARTIHRIASEFAQSDGRGSKAHYHHTRLHVRPGTMPYTIAADPYFREAAKIRTPSELEAAVLLLETHYHGRPVAESGRRQEKRSEASIHGARATDTGSGQRHDSLPTSSYRLHPRSEANTRESKRQRQSIAATQGIANRQAGMDTQGETTKGHSTSSQARSEGHVS